MTDNTELRRIVSECLAYDADTGIFRRTKTIGKVRSGSVAGTVNRSNGYRYISVGGKRYLAHRLAWFIVHGEFPPADIDHIDGCRDNNAISNLRPATRSQNLGNARGYGRCAKGVHFMKARGTWNAKLRNKHLGAFKTEAEAAAAYAAAAKDYFGEFARVDK